MPRYVFRLLSVVLLSALSLPALAAEDVTPGCHADVWRALNAKAQAQVAYDMAVTRALMNEPDSVLTLTCFDRLAGAAAKTGGTFSGDFSGPLHNIIPSVPTNVSTYTCTSIKDAWNEMLKADVVQFPSFEDFVNNNVPAATAGTQSGDFYTAYQAAQNSNPKLIGDNSLYNEAISALAPLQQALPPTTDLAKAQSSCKVLEDLGIITANGTTLPCAEDNTAAAPPTTP